MPRRSQSSAMLGLLLVTNAAMVIAVAVLVYVLMSESGRELAGLSAGAATSSRVNMANMPAAIVDEPDAQPPTSVEPAPTAGTMPVAEPPKPTQDDPLDRLFDRPTEVAMEPLPPEPPKLEIPAIEEARVLAADKKFKEAVDLLKKYQRDTPADDRSDMIDDLIRHLEEQIKLSEIEEMGFF